MDFLSCTQFWQINILVGMKHTVIKIISSNEIWNRHVDLTFFALTLFYIFELACTLKISIGDVLSACSLVYAFRCMIEQINCHSYRTLHRINFPYRRSTGYKDKSNWWIVDHAFQNILYPHIPRPINILKKSFSIIIGSWKTFR